VGKVYLTRKNAGIADGINAGINLEKKKRGKAPELYPIV